MYTKEELEEILDQKGNIESFNINERGDYLVKLKPAVHEVQIEVVVNA